MTSSKHVLNRLLEELPDDQIPFEKLSERHKIIIARTRDGTSLKEIGKEIGNVTPERVRQIKFNLYMKLKYHRHESW